MSTVANPEAKKSASRSANVFVGFMAVCATATLTNAALHGQPWHSWEWATLVVLAALTARMKLQLPGVTGNMSVSLPFILIAMTRLSLLEAMLVGGVSVFIQSVPKVRRNLNFVHAVFNVSTALLATSFGWNIFHVMLGMGFNAAVALAGGCAMQFVISTTPVAAVIALTEHLNAVHSWNEIVSLAFPYYLASTGLASIAASIGGNNNLPMLVGMLLVMMVTYRSYRMYFGLMSSKALPSGAKVQAAAAGR